MGRTFTGHLETFVDLVAGGFIAGAIAILINQAGQLTLKFMSTSIIVVAISALIYIVFHSIVWFFKKVKILSE